MKTPGSINLCSRRLRTYAAWYVGLYLGCVGLLGLGFWRFGIDLAMFEAAEAQLNVEAMQRISFIYLTCGCIGLAILRLYGTHPVFNPNYLHWLRTTPWRRGMPMPCGSPLPGWSDAVLLGILLGYGFFHLPNHLVLGLIPLYPITYALLALVAILYPGKQPRIAHALALLLLGTVLLTFVTTPWVPQGLALLMGAVAMHGIWSGLEQLPHHSENRPFLQRYKHMSRFTGVEPIDYNPPTRWRTALAGCALIAYWAGLLSTLSDTVAMFLLFGFLFGLIIRLHLYIGECAPPISWLDRLRQRRWIIPEYDVVFVAPLFAMLAVFMLGVGGRVLDVPLPLPLHVGLVVFVALLILIKVGPARRQWKLTGSHRIVNPNVRR